MRPTVAAAGLFVLAAACASLAAAQTPSPFPRPSSPRPATPPPATPPSGTPAPATAPVREAATPAASEPAAGTLGVPIYPGAQFLVSFNAGQGQRFYLYGTNTPFAEIVGYYRNVLKQRGELVYDEPPIHEFDVGRYREESMAFPPSVTVKDYMWGGSKGYLNPVRGQEPARFSTVIQIVPETTAAPPASQRP